MSKFPMTPLGAKALEEELKKLKQVTRPQLTEAIATAREFGDLSENAEYKAAREAQSFCEGRIRELEHKLSSIQIIDPESLKPDGPVMFGKAVHLLHLKTGNRVWYQIVGEDEADLKKGKISVRSPLAKSLIGKEEGEEATVFTPKGEDIYEILEVVNRLPSDLKVS